MLIQRSAPHDGHSGNHGLHRSSAANLYDHRMGSGGNWLLLLLLLMTAEAELDIAFDLLFIEGRVLIR